MDAGGAAAFDFPKQFSEFSFKTLLTKAEVIAALAKAKVECAKVGGWVGFRVLGLAAGAGEEGGAGQREGGRALA